MGVWVQERSLGRSLNLQIFWCKDGIYGHEIGRNYNENECERDEDKGLSSKFLVT